LNYVSVRNFGGAPNLNYEARWKLLADLAAELRKSGEPVPPDVIRDLRSAKTMIEVLKVDRSRAENLLRIEEYLDSVESHLLSAAKRKLGEEYVDEWLGKVAEAQRGVRVCEPKPSRRFPIGVPRDKSWVRIKPSAEITLEKIKKSSKEIGLGLKTQRDGYVLVYGEEDKVKRFIHMTAYRLREDGSRSVT